MNEEANKILVGLLQKASNGIDTAVSFSQAQLPDIIQQLMIWRAAAYGMRILVMLSFLVACVLLFRKAWAWKDSYETDTQGTICCMLSAFTGAMLLIGILVSIGNALQIWLAPKIWLIEYAASLMK